jgi:cytochrome c oxidase subunit 2
MPTRVRRAGAPAAAAVAAVLLACGQNGQSTLHPAGPGADRIAELWWMMLAASVAVFALVIFVLVRSFTHPGPRSELYRSGDEDRRATHWVLAGGVGLPILVLTPLFLFTLHTLRALSPADADDPLEIVVTGHQWWWEVEYAGDAPGEQLRTANEIHIPVGRPVRVRLRASDVIHSFWVPALQGKLDLVPGRENATWIQADSAGVYGGECAEYCGLQHARMQFRVVAQPAGEFAEWRAAQSAPAAGATDSAAPAGRAVFMGAGCALCHTVRGTEALGRTGPDLTHLASRRTLAAGTIPNTRGHLTGWIANPEGIKPGTRMPRVPLAADELNALVAWLQTLH